MASEIDSEDVSAVMTQVLERMDRIVEHMRSKGEVEAANKIAKDIISIINNFNEVTAPWDIETSMMPSFPQPMSDLSGEPAQRSSGRNTHVRGGREPTWAAIAAVTPGAENNLVKTAPTGPGKTPKHLPQPRPSKDQEDSRVVWIMNWGEERPLSEVTQNIGHGPIYSMAYSPPDRSVCVIFQYASSAKALVEDDRIHLQRKGSSRFGPRCDLVLGRPYQETEDLRRMSAPMSERRRLTFARQQLFSHSITEASFTAVINSIVGASNVELIWLFNAGNATAVFSSVPIARMVHDEFRKMGSSKNSAYHRVHISFSHDPCERPMSLTTQMPAGRSLVSNGTYGRNGVVPTGPAGAGGPTSRPDVNATDVDGWRTVGKKR